jgi:nucleotide-binding universal stress UspA family protein
MKIIFAADGSECTKKALAFLVTHENLAGAEDEVLVLNVQPRVLLGMRPIVSPDLVNEHYRDEANRVLDPIKTFLDRHPIRYRCEWVVGSAATEIVAASKHAKVQLIVMGTHGHSPIGRMLMGSVAQRVVAECDVPVLLVK